MLIQDDPGFSLIICLHVATCRPINEYGRKSAEYVVLLGDVGSGKSTVVEKLTGEKGRSSESSISYTRTSEAFRVPDGSLIISDTPGSNAMDYQLEHNVWIAAAFNYRLVSRLFIVAKAENRKDTVIDSISKYANRFLEPAEMDVLGVLRPRPC